MISLESPEIIDDGSLFHIHVKLAVYHVVVAPDGRSVRCLETSRCIECENRQSGLEAMARHLAGR